MVAKIFQMIYMAYIVFVLDSTFSIVLALLKGLANCNNPDTSILMSILSAWQPVILLMWFSSVPSAQTQTYDGGSGHMCHKNSFTMAYSLGDVREILAMCSFLFELRLPLLVQVSLVALGIIPHYFKHLIIWKN